MSKILIDTPVRTDVCDLCGEPMSRESMSNHPGEFGHVLRGYGLQATVHTKWYALIWPPAGRDRTMTWREKQEPQHKERRYDFHADCILTLVESNLHPSVSGEDKVDE